MGILLLGDTHEEAAGPGLEQLNTIPTRRQNLTPCRPVEEYILQCN
jgi:hypothetical protein